MEVIGILLLPVFLFYSWKFSKYPVVPKRFLQNKTVVLAALIGAFDFVSFYLSFTYLYSFVVIVKPWPLIHATYFAQTQTVALTVFAIVAGVVARFTRRCVVFLLLFFLPPSFFLSLSFLFYSPPFLPFFFLFFCILCFIEHRCYNSSPHNRDFFPCDFYHDFSL